MSELMRKFSLEHARYGAQVWLFALLLWFIVVACTVTSICSQAMTWKQRTLWLLLVICVPLIGVLAYLPFSIPRDDLPQMLLLKRSKPRRPVAPRRIKAD